ncbi:DUF6907 domain-containing protein [Streptomyces mirabilis]|uniref:DUF6907 domain-containing protein n=1 Tax=Streptomyces mirabilis TaxID=68239 RepID=UPI0036C3DD34
MAQSAISTPRLYPLPAPKPGYRFVPALIGRSTEPGVIIHLQCPNWCVTDHMERTGSVEDVNHQGAHRALSLTPSFGDRVPVAVYLSEWPASYCDNKPTLAVDLDCEVDTYGRTAALALADQLVAFAADVRRLAQTLPDDSPAPVRNQADEALRQVRGEAV